MEEDEAVAPAKIPAISAPPKTSHGGRASAPPAAPAAAAKPAGARRIEIEPEESFDKILKRPS